MAAMPTMSRITPPPMATTGSRRRSPNCVNCSRICSGGVWDASYQPLSCRVDAGAGVSPSQHNKKKSIPSSRTQPITHLRDRLLPLIPLLSGQHHQMCLHAVVRVVPRQLRPVQRVDVGVWFWVGFCLSVDLVGGSGEGGFMTECWFLIGLRRPRVPSRPSTTHTQHPSTHRRRRSGGPPNRRGRVWWPTRRSLGRGGPGPSPRHTRRAGGRCCATRSAAPGG